MKRTFIALLLVGLLASCTKETIVPMPTISIDGIWYSSPDLSPLNAYMINLSDSSLTIDNKKTKFYLLPLNHCFFMGDKVKYNFDAHYLEIGNSPTSASNLMLFR